MIDSQWEAWTILTNVRRNNREDVGGVKTEIYRTNTILAHIIQRQRNQEKDRDERKAESKTGRVKKRRFT